MLCALRAREHSTPNALGLEVRLRRTLWQRCPQVALVHSGGLGREVGCEPRVDHDLLQLDARRGVGQQHALQEVPPLSCEEESVREDNGGAALRGRGEAWNGLTRGGQGSCAAALA